MYTEEEHEQLFKRFFGETATLKYNDYIGVYDMRNDTSYFCSGFGRIVYVPYSLKPYTKMMEYLYGKDIWVFVDKGFDGKIKHVINVPSSFEEMSIICDLKGK